MAFNLYFAGQQAKEIDVYLREHELCRLFSFVNEAKGIDEYLEAPKRGKLFIDSGAFTEAHSGKPVNIDEHIAYMNARPSIEVWAQLDKIPFPVVDYNTFSQSSEISWVNYLYEMERLTINRDKLLPIYHFGEPKTGLKRILNTEVNGKLPEYIGVGGRHGVSTKQQDEYFEDIFNIIKESKSPNVKVHAFGMTVLNLLERYPFYSADSTTWLMIGINGGVLTRAGGIVNISDRQKYNMDNFANYPQELRSKLNEEFESRGYTEQGLATDYKQRLIFNIDYLAEWAENYKYTPRQVKRKRLFSM